MGRKRKKKLLNYYKSMANYQFKRAEREHIDSVAKDVKIKCLEVKNKMLLDKIAELNNKTAIL